MLAPMPLSARSALPRIRPLQTLRASRFWPGPSVLNTIDAWDPSALTRHNSFERVGMSPNGPVTPHRNSGHSEMATGD
jgi:hypothetical protein